MIWFCSCMSFDFGFFILFRFILFYFFFTFFFFVGFSCFLVPIWFRLDRYRHQRRGRCSYRAVRGRVRLVLSPPRSFCGQETHAWEEIKSVCLCFVFCFQGRNPIPSLPPAPTLTDAIYFTSWASDNPFFFFFLKFSTWLNYFESRLCSGKNS